MVHTVEKPAAVTIWQDAAGQSQRYYKVETFTPTPQGPGISPPIEVIGEVKIDDQAKVGGTSAFFDGNGDYLSLADSSDTDLSGGVWTLDFWINPTSFAGGNVIYAQETGRRINRNSIHVDGGGQVYFQVITEGQTALSLTDVGAVLNRNTWQHVAVVENGSQYYLFIDGALKASLTSSSRPADYTGPVLIGAGDIGNGLSQFHKGNLDEFRISKGIARWTTSFTPPLTIERDSSTNLLLHFTENEFKKPDPSPPVIIASDGEQITVEKRDAIYIFKSIRLNQILAKTQTPDG